jgi:hypothetical protein
MQSPLGDRYFVLTMARHGLIARERAEHGVNIARYLNAAGRWAAAGKRVPILAWMSEEEAKSAALVATAARKKAVTVTMVGGSDWRLGKWLRQYSPMDAEALSGYVDVSAQGSTGGLWTLRPKGR